jgi:hypothetical protein
MTDEVLDIVPVEHNMIFVPDVGKALEAWKAYQNLVKSLLDENDYTTIRGKKHRKRSGWTKLRRAFNITTTVIDHAWEDLGDGDFGFYVTVRTMFPDGRCEDGDGYCDSIEMANGNIQPTRHNIRSKAITRAKNRATADLIGSGEVSAEEFIDEQPKRQPTRKAKPQPRKTSNGNGPITRPMTPAQLRAALQTKTEMRGEKGTGPASEKQATFLARKFQEAFGGDADADKKYHLSLEWLWNVDSAKKLTMGQAASALDWLLSSDGPDDTGDTPLHEHASKEARHVWREAMKDAGQTEMFDEPEDDPVSA